MTNAQKGVLLSALVLPGLGQFVLKRRLRGIVLMIAILGLLGAMMVRAMDKAMTIIDNIDMQVAQVDANVIYDAVKQATTGFDSLLSGLLLLGWLAIAIDAYFVGRKLDNERQSSAETV